MKKFLRIFIYFNLIACTVYNPSTLYSQSLESIKNAYGEDAVKIILRLYPNFFDDQTQQDYSRLLYNLYLKHIPEREINLSNLNIGTIPIKIAKMMTHVEKLNLSDNKNLKLNEAWLSYFYNNLKELTLKCCNLIDENLKAISKFKSLERLDLSRLEKFDIKILELILKNLKHLDVSYSGFSISELKYILDRADKLESLDFSGNDLSGKINLANLLSENHSLTNLNLSSCKLGFEEIKNIILFSNLEVLDFSFHDLSYSENIVISKLKSAWMNFYNLIDNYVYNFEKEYPKRPTLKKINLSKCYLNNPSFMKILFDIEGLEVLNLGKCDLDFDMKDILNGKAKDTLKELYVPLCKIKLAETLEYITNFTQLERLDFYGNQTDFPDKFSFGQSKNSLKYLDLSLANLNSSAFKSISECTCLEILDMQGVNLSKIITSKDMSIGNLKNTLKELNLSYCQANHISFKLFTDCPNLQNLDFRGNDLSLFIEEYSLGRSKESLKEINLEETNINQEILFDISDCPNLEKLDISKNNFESLPSDFEFGRSAKSLKILKMTNTCLNSNGLKAISKFNKLEELWVSENKFSDLPNNFRFGSLENSLKKLIISDSNINLSCLDAISKCRKLKNLNIRDNVIIRMNDPRVITIIQKLKKFIYSFIIY